MLGRFLNWLPVRPRTALGIGLLLVVAVVVAFGKLIGGSQRSTGFPDGTTPLSTVNPSAGNDSVADLVPTPTLGDTGSAEVTAAATHFATLWIDHNKPAKAWRDSLLPLCTKALAAELSGADPATVPANRITGPATLDVHADTTVDAIIPIDAGRLRLRMVVQQNKWLVDGIDWERV
jgi:hypothetical protein